MIPLYRAIAQSLVARENCAKAGNVEWHTRHEARAHRLVRSLLPSGSGFDTGTKLDTAMSTPDRLVFRTAFHHMDEHGGYDGWTEHTITVTPSLALGFDLRVTGSNRNDIKEHIAQAFHDALAQKINEQEA